MAASCSGTIFSLFIIRVIYPDFFIFSMFERRGTEVVLMEFYDDKLKKVNTESNIYSKTEVELLYSLFSLIIIIDIALFVLVELIS